MSNGIDDKLKFEFYQLEYERAAIRYENIYNAVWQIFAYMSAISGALLAFGGGRLQSNFFWFLVCLPLVFWYWATFVPLNKYGDECNYYLSVLEKKINKFGVNLEHYTRFKDRENKKIETVKFLIKINDFKWGECYRDLNKAWRVRTPIKFLFGVLTVICLFNLIITGAVIYNRKPLTYFEASKPKTIIIMPSDKYLKPDTIDQTTEIHYLPQKQIEAKVKEK